MAEAGAARSTGAVSAERPVPRIFASAADFRAWLLENHDTAKELWVGYYKKGVPKSSMRYVESVEEALCFGWIDGLARGVDHEVTSIRFTPRRRTSNWSATNLARIAALTEAGRMHPAGTRAFEERDRRKEGVYSYERPPQELPAEWTSRFQADHVAWRYWEGETPYYRRTATHWVVSAKRPGTRERRFETLVADSRAGRRVKPFIVARQRE
jgi:uncharacterized protein YdeI (YjbR/CyaY-like superfamily)